MQIQIPIKPIMETIEVENVLQRSPGKYESVGNKIGKLVDKKNEAYGDAFNKSSDFLKILYPDGVKVEQYGDMLALIRIFDKQMRIATAKEALEENPFEDIAGYGILKS